MRPSVSHRCRARNGYHLQSRHRSAPLRVDLAPADRKRAASAEGLFPALPGTGRPAWRGLRAGERELARKPRLGGAVGPQPVGARCLECRLGRSAARSEEHTSELQSLMRISYAVFCLKKKKIPTHTHKSK